MCRSAVANSGQDKGQVERVVVMESDFGKERMEEEEKHGPAVLRSRRNEPNQGKESEEEEEEEERDVRDVFKNQNSPSKEEEEEDEIEDDLMRAYELEKLKFLFL